MTTDHIEHVAQAGFATYFSNRPGYTWRTSCFPIRCRWGLIAAAFVNGNHDASSALFTARRLRTAYTQDTYCAPHSFRTDRAWQRVYAAMATARTSALPGREGIAA